MQEEPIATQELISVRDTVSLKEAAALMSDMSIGAIAIHDADQRFVGLLTERDMLWCVARERDPVETAVREVMNELPVVVEGPVTTTEAGRRMISGHVRHLIVRENGGLRIVGMRDVVEGLVGDEMAAAVHVASLAEMRRWFNLRQT